MRYLYTLPLLLTADPLTLALTAAILTLCLAHELVAD